MSVRLSAQRQVAGATQAFTRLPVTKSETICDFFLIAELQIEIENRREIPRSRECERDVTPVDSKRSLEIVGPGRCQVARPPSPFCLCPSIVGLFFRVPQACRSRGRQIESFKRYRVKEYEVFSWKRKDQMSRLRWRFDLSPSNCP